MSSPVKSRPRYTLKAKVGSARDHKYRAKTRCDVMPVRADLLLGVRRIDERVDGEPSLNEVVFDGRTELGVHGAGT